ncbi:hypothetical protein G3A_12620 [Bacillus sp. 17376]|nr:hypothetical protein G3A_12620 [Bacillus sp. 17376]
MGQQNMKAARMTVDEAIKNGISKEDFSYYLDFMKFKSWRKQD